MSAGLLCHLPVQVALLSWYLSSSGNCQNGLEVVLQGTSCNYNWDISSGSNESVADKTAARFRKCMHAELQNESCQKQCNPNSLLGCFGL